MCERDDDIILLTEDEQLEYISLVHDWTAYDDDLIFIVDEVQ